MEVRIQNVEFVKQVKGGGIVRHKSRIITYADIKKHKLISLLTNDMASDPKGIIADEAELPPEILLWESANAIKIQKWVTLIANLLLMVIRRKD